MKYQVTLETAITVTRYGVGPLSCWPLPAGSSRWVILQHNVRVWIAIVNLVIAIGASLNTMYEYRDDVSKIVKVASEMSVVIATVAKIIICKIQAPRMQGCIANMEAFLKQATRNEKEMIQGYVDKCSPVYMIVFVSVVVGPLAFIAGPLITSQPFPGDVIYPFPTESTWIWATFYISQSVCVIQTGSMIITDVMFGMLLWYAGARFHMLSLDFRKVTNADEVNRCIQQHQELIGYVDELTITARIIAVQVTMVGIFSIITGGFILIGDPPLYEWAKYVCFELASVMQLFLIAWPADHLIDVSESIGHAAYDCHWIGKPPEMLKNIIFIIQRSRNPMIIAVNGLLPVLSLEFYGSTMAAAFSYLTTLRAVVADST